MKSSVLLICAVLVVSSVSAFAGINNDTLKTNVPFDFVINNKAFPAGHYTVERLSDSNMSLIIRSEDSKSSMIFTPATVDADNLSGSKLVFQRDGATYSLLTVAGELASYGIAPTRSRRVIAKRQDATPAQATP